MIRRRILLRSEGKFFSYFLRSSIACMTLCIIYIIIVSKHTIKQRRQGNFSPGPQSRIIQPTQEFGVYTTQDLPCYSSSFNVVWNIEKSLRMRIHACTSCMVHCNIITTYLFHTLVMVHQILMHGYSTLGFHNRTSKLNLTMNKYTLYQQQYWVQDYPNLLPM